ncbi:MAG: hypothetical protein ABR590_03875 [Spirochaetia bacterium]
MSGRSHRARLVTASILVLIVLLPAALPAMDQTAGSLRLELLSATSSFRVFLRTLGASTERPSALKTTEDQRGIPLLYPDDPTTSFFSLREDGRVYHPARDRDFQRMLVETENGYPAFVFTSRDIEIRQVFVPHPGRRTAADAFEIRLEIRNASTRTRTIDLRYVLDTHIGESSGIHGVLELGNGNQQIPTHEISIDLDNYDAIRTTRNSAAPDAFGLQIPLTTVAAGNIEITKPERVVIANWRRIQESGWNYTPTQDRGFSYPPYSRNDSAIVLLYSEIRIQPGEEKHISLVLQATPVELPSSPRAEQAEAHARGQAQSVALIELEQRVVEYEEAELSEPQSLELRLELIDEVINQIDRRLSDPNEFDDSKLPELEQLLQRLE